MKKAYEYLYYKVLDFLITVNPKNTIASWSALCFTTALDFTFLFTILIVLHLYMGFDLYQFLTKFNTISVAGLIMVLNYFLLYHKNTHQQIMKKFSKESEQQRKKGNTIVLIIIIGIFVCLFYFGSILKAEFIKNHQDNIAEMLK